MDGRRGFPRMHEFALCQALLTTVARLAAQHHARAVGRVRLAVGPLSGAEPALLTRAFALARMGTIAEGATLEVVLKPTVIACAACRAEFAVEANRLLCPSCGGRETRLVGGDELILETLDLEVDETPPIGAGASKARAAAPPP